LVLQWAAIICFQKVLDVLYQVPYLGIDPFGINFKIIAPEVIELTCHVRLAMAIGLATGESTRF